MYFFVCRYIIVRYEISKICTIIECAFKINKLIRIFITFCTRNSDRVEKSIAISHVAMQYDAVQWSKVSVRFRRLATNRILFYHISSVRVLQNREFIRRDGIFGDDEFCGSSRGRAPPRNFHSSLLLPQLFLWIAQTGAKWENSVDISDVFENYRQCTLLNS